MRCWHAIARVSSIDTHTGYNALSLQRVSKRHTQTLLLLRIVVHPFDDDQTTSPCSSTKASCSRREHTLRLLRNAVNHFDGRQSCTFCALRCRFAFQRPAHVTVSAKKYILSNKRLQQLLTFHQCDGACSAQRRARW